MYLRLIGSLTILLFLATTGLAEPIHIKVAPLSDAGAPNVLASKYLTKLITERSSGRLQVAIIDNTDLAPDNFAEAFHTQDIQLALIDIEKLRQHFPLLKVYELPFLFQDRRHLRRTIDSDIGQQIIRSAQANDLHPLAVWDNASRQTLSSSDRQISEARASQILSDTLFMERKQGATWRDCSLNKIPFEAKEHSLGTVIMTNHRFSCCVLLTSSSFWKQLPKDLKVIIDGAVMDATRYHRELTEQADAEALERIERSDELKTIYLTAEERQNWFEATRQLYLEVTTQEESILIEKISRNTMKKG